MRPATCTAICPKSKVILDCIWSHHMPSSGVLRRLALIHWRFQSPFPCTSSFLPTCGSTLPWPVYSLPTYFSGMATFAGNLPPLKKLLPHKRALSFHVLPPLDSDCLLSYQTWSRSYHVRHLPRPPAPNGFLPRQVTKSFGNVVN